MRQPYIHAHPIYWYPEMRRPRLRGSRVALALILAAGLALRILPAPISAGSDIAQFAGFADSFLRHGACFYKYAPASSWEEEGWPYNWPYVYGPLWIMVLGVLRILAPHRLTTYWRGDTYYVYIPREWIAVVKSALIAGDLVSAVLLYALVRRRFGDRWGLASAALYLLSPATIYVSAIYGMFDQLALAMLLAGMALLETRPLAAGVLAGYSIAAKQVVAPPLLGLAAYVAMRRPRLSRSFLTGLAIGLAAPFLPFAAMCSSSVPSAVRSMLAAPRPGPVEPLSYSFNGISSLATYLYQERHVTGALQVIEHWWVLALLLAAPAVYTMVSRSAGPPYRHMLALYLVFLASYWRINYQYFVVLIGLLVLYLPYAKTCTRLALAQLYIASNSWVFVYPLSWWFHVHIQSPDESAWRIIDRLTLMIFDDAFYVAFSLGLTFLTLSAFICVLVEKPR